MERVLAYAHMLGLILGYGKLFLDTGEADKGLTHGDWITFRRANTWIDPLGNV
jgi:hypothetical protein